jgi:hypothetical protein
MLWLILLTHFAVWVMMMTSRKRRIRLVTSSELVRTGKKLSALEERRNYGRTNDGEKCACRIEAG